MTEQEIQIIAKKHYKEYTTKGCRNPNCVLNTIRKALREMNENQVTLGLPSVIDRLKSIKRYTESYGEGDYADDGEYIWYEDLEQVIKDFE